MSELREIALRTRAAWRELSVADTETKNRALRRMAEALPAGREGILAANARDLAAAREKGMKEAFIERLTLTDARLSAMADGIRAVAALPDPVGELLEEGVRPNGLVIRKRRVPLGVVGIVYESRPNVTSDAAALCLKSGNACILRGGSDAYASSQAVVQALRGALAESGLSPDCVSLAPNASRETVRELMTMNDLVDVLIPRGGKGLIRSVVENATVPVIQTGDGVCHVYVDHPCDLDMAVKIAVSAKVSRPSVCNSAETLLVHEKIAPDFLPRCLRELEGAGVEVRGCEKTRALCPEARPAAPEDWDTEYNDLIYSVKVVASLDEAIDHINRHGTRHSEAIVTSDPAHGRRFQALVDAAAVYVNASTRFTDGGEFGLGAEIGISNQKLHARGPMGLCELTTYKYEIDGSGQVR